MSYIVLVEDPNGTINLGLHNFTAFDVRQRFFHPNASATATFRFISQWPNGTQIGFNVGVAPVFLHPPLPFLRSPPSPSMTSAS